MPDIPQIPTPKATSSANTDNSSWTSTTASASTPPPTVAPPLSLPEGDRSATGAVYQWRCTRCGSTDRASAYLIDYSDKFRQLHLAPRALKLPKISRMLRPFHNMLKVNAQVCRNCGAVTLEVNPDDLAEAERKFGRR